MLLYRDKVRNSKGNLQNDFRKLKYMVLSIDRLILVPQKIQDNFGVSYNEKIIDYMSLLWNKLSNSKENLENDFGKLIYMFLSMNRIILLPWKFQEKFGDLIKKK